MTLPTAPSLPSLLTKMPSPPTVRREHPTDPQVWQVAAQALTKNGANELEHAHELDEFAYF
jgi:hypothetical protein